MTAVPGEMRVTVAGAVAPATQILVIPDSQFKHAISDVTGLQAALDSKAAASDTTAASLLAKIITVDGKGSGLDADTVDGKDSTAFAAASHTHTIADVTGLQAALDSKTTILSSGGSPLGVVTPTTATQLYVDTAATVGARLWLSTGTTNTSWTVVAGDTAVRNVAPLNGWTFTNLHLRRINGVVKLGLYNGSPTNATSTTIYTLPVGFRPATVGSTMCWMYRSNATAGHSWGLISASSGSITVANQTDTVAPNYMEIIYDTTDPWPTAWPA